MRLIIYAILLYIAYRLIKSWLLRMGGASSRSRFSEPNSQWSHSTSSGREKDVTERSRVLND